MVQIDGPGGLRETKSARTIIMARPPHPHPKFSRSRPAIPVCPVSRPISSSSRRGRFPRAGTLAASLPACNRFGARETKRCTSCRKAENAASLPSPCPCISSAVCMSPNMIGRSQASIMAGRKVLLRSAGVASAAPGARRRSVWTSSRRRLSHCQAPPRRPRHRPHPPATPCPTRHQGQPS